MSDIVERLIVLRDVYRNTLSRENLDLLADAANLIGQQKAALREAKGALAICDHPSAGSGDGLTIIRGGKPIGAIIDRALVGACQQQAVSKT